MTKDTEVDAEHEAQMIATMQAIDEFFNPDVRGDDRKVGVVLLVFPFGEGGRANYMSNGVSRKDMATLFKEMAARLEGQPEIKGRG